MAAGRAAKNGTTGTKKHITQLPATKVAHDCRQRNKERDSRKESRVPAGRKTMHDRRQQKHTTADSTANNGTGGSDNITQLPAARKSQQPTTRAC
eukprot:4756871-Alexandrium_andersonii.AAC.1